MKLFKKAPPVQAAGYIMTPEAARRANVTRTSVVIWCMKYGIGKKIAGRWHVDPVLLDKVLSGEIPNAEKNEN